MKMDFFNKTNNSMITVKAFKQNWYYLHCLCKAYSTFIKHGRWHIENFRKVAYKSWSTILCPINATSEIKLINFRVTNFSEILQGAQVWCRSLTEPLYNNTTKSLGLVLG